ncbi:amino acid ABC transporter substrate-binding protein [Ottowia testudinis]|uniref:Amino acid ABC transporter substrate-binding protein n=1 Tax=Ottowia testudinis TaxID=2816950 RepID=A0A975CKS6_9BURK|nr:amino acid ABC transporter substrate-binding protein [Ottowia testudinis]QTD46019.1 amino acid ABC transporter substrate-binding protein [Ottowia testudinis]
MRSVFYRQVRCVPAVLVLGFAASLQAHAGVLADIQKRGEVVLGYREDGAPISYLAKGDAQPSGFAVDLCRAVIDQMVAQKVLPAGLRIKYVPLTNAERFKAITERRVDAECADTTNNRERREKIGVAFTIPHYFAGVRMMVTKKSGIKRIEDLRQKRVLYTKGTTTHQIVQERNGSLNLNLTAIECTTPAECFRDLNAGKGDAYMMDDIQLYALRATAPTPDDWDIVGKMLSIEPLAIMLPKNDDEWKGQFDVILRKMIYDGTFAAKYKTWFESPLANLKVNFNIPMNYLLKDSLKFPTDKVGD